MDEPTSALNDTEIDRAVPHHPRAEGRGVGIVYISHKMDELKQIADRVTVMRDGEYVATVAAGDTDRRNDHLLMVGRDLADARARRRTPAARRGRARSQDLQRAAPLVRDVTFSLRKGEILGFAGLMGAGRTEVARAVFGADPIDIRRNRRARREGGDRDAEPTRCARHRLSVGGPQAFRPCHGDVVEANIVDGQSWPQLPLAQLVLAPHRRCARPPRISSICCHSRRPPRRRRCGCCRAATSRKS